MVSNYKLNVIGQMSFEAASKNRWEMWRIWCLGEAWDWRSTAVNNVRSVLDRSL